MIWNPQQPPEGYTEAVEEIIAELGELCGQTLSPDTGKLHEVALAVEAALEEGGAEAGLDTSMLVTLASRALASIGEERAARRLYWLGAGVVRPSEWNVAGDATMWVIDLAGLSAAAGPVLELDLLYKLDLILDCIADVWDESDGHGVLGFLHIDEADDKCARPGAHKTPLYADLKERCLARLADIGTQRGWGACPEVLALDMRR